MSGIGKKFGTVRTILSGCCVVLLVIGLLLIPFVPNEISIGIAIAAVLLYFAIRFLVPKTGDLPGPDGQRDVAKQVDGERRS